MSNGVGISSSQAERIAERAASRVESRLERKINSVARDVSGLERKMNEVRQQVRQLDNRLTAVEREMGKVADAISNMGQNLARKLEGVEQATTASKRVNEAILASNAAGFAATNKATTSIGNQITTSVDHNTSALVETEYLRLYNEARSPIRKIQRFGREVDDRFTAAVEGVHKNRELYDIHFQQIIDGYREKLGVIGAHIYRVLEQDFEPTIGLHLTIPPSVYRELPEYVDRARVHERERQLDQDLDQLYEHNLLPKLNMADDFERALEERHGLERVPAFQRADVPITLVFDTQGHTAVHTGEKVDRARSGGAGVHFGFRRDDRYDGIREHVQEGLGEIGRALSLRQLTTNERAWLTKTLTKMAADGLFEQELLQGYLDYLDKFGLQVAVPSSQGAQ